MSGSTKRLRRVSLFCLFAIVLCEHSLALRPAATPAESYEHAARQNAQLRHQLIWVFGGKQQRGWHLYVPLIGRLLDVEDEPDSPPFARAVERWQARLRLAPTGILDRETWMTMVAVLQAQRSQRRSGLSAGSLIQAPVEDFFDPARPGELRYVDREAYAAYKRMLQAAKDELASAPLGRASKDSGAFLKIISAYRSPTYQALLRQRSPHSGRAGLAVHSPHFTGRALDLHVGGDPVNTADHNRLAQINTPIYRWLVKHAAKFGFYPYFYEPWHWEYRG